jgi:predicted phosphodiesterase
MNSAFLADIHSDISSLKRVLNFLKSKSIDNIYCLGDIIGYGDYPNEVISLLKESGAISILGNHEKMFLKGIYPEEYNLVYTKNVITDASLEYLKSLPENIILKDHKAILSHAVPFTDNEYFYVNSDFSIFDNIDHELIFLGHTHRPMLMSYHEKKIINPGSVGPARDKNEKSSLLICDLDNQRFEFIRI